MKNIKYISPAILTAALLSVHASKLETQISINAFLSPKSVMYNKEKTEFLSIFKNAYTAYDRNKSLSKENKKRILQYISNTKNPNIKILTEKFFPDNKDIINQYRWIAGSNICIGLNYEQNEAIIIPTNEKTGIDYGIREPIKTTIAELETSKFITKLIEDKDADEIMKRYIILSGIDGISGFLNNGDFFERFQILFSYYDIFYNIDPEKTLYKMLENVFAYEELHKAIFTQKLLTNETSDSLFIKTTNILAEKNDERMFAENTIKILEYLIPKINRDTLQKSMLTLEQKAYSSFQSLMESMKKNQPSLLIDVAEYFIKNDDHKDDFFLVESLIKLLQDIKSEQARDLLVDIIMDEQTEKTNRLKALNNIHLLLPEIKLTQAQKKQINPLLIKNAKRDHKSLSSFISILAESKNNNDLALIKEIYNTPALESKDSIYLALASLNSDATIDFLIEEGKKYPENKLLTTIISRLETDKTYPILYSKLQNAKNLTNKIAILKDMSYIQGKYLPITAVEDMKEILQGQSRITDDMYKLALTVIINSDTIKGLNFIKDTLNDIEADDSIKKIALETLQNIQSKETFSIIIESINNNPETAETAFIIMTNLQYELFPETAAESITQLIEKYSQTDNNIHLLLETLVNTTNKQNYKLIYKNIEKNLDRLTATYKNDILKIFLSKCDDTDTLINMLFNDKINPETKDKALTKIRTLDLNNNQIKAIAKILTYTETDIFLDPVINILLDNINNFFPALKTDIIKSLSDPKTHLTIKNHWVEVLENLDDKHISYDLLAALNIFSAELPRFNPKHQANRLIQRFSNIIEDKAPQKNFSMAIFKEFDQATSQDKKLNILYSIKFSNDIIENTRISENLLHFLTEGKNISPELKAKIGEKLINKGGRYKKELIDTLMNQIINNDNISPQNHTIYIRILKAANAENHLLLFNKIMTDWEKFGISSSDIAKAYLTAGDKNNFIESIKKIINIKDVKWETISWNEPSELLINESFFKLKESVKRRDIKKAFKLIYAYLDLDLKTDIKLGEEYEIVGRENVPLDYYEFFTSGADENEIITPPSNPMYQRIFARHVPSEKAGVHRTVEQRVSYNDAKLINLFCQMYSMGSIKKDILIGKEINPKSSNMWSIRYDTHSSNTYGEGRYLLQTTDWKNHTSGSLMWFFMNYADKFPLRWIELRKTLLKSLEDLNINLYEYDAEGDEVVSPIIKKDPETNKELTVPKYIYDLTRIQPGQNDCNMRLIVNNKEIVDALTEMVLYTTENIALASADKKKIMAFETLREIYKTVARGEIPDRFSNYRNLNAVSDSFKAMEDYFTNYNDEAIYSYKQKSLLEKSA